MSDGHTDASYDAVDAFGQYLKDVIACVGCGSSATAVKPVQVHKHILLTDLGQPAWLIDRFCQFNPVCYGLQSVCDLMFSMLYAKRHVEMSLFHKACPIIFGYLIVMTDDKWHAHEHGVHYQTLNDDFYFSDGHQDIVVGQVKLRYGKQLIAGRPFMAFASWDREREIWIAFNGAQPGGINPFA